MGSIRVACDECGKMMEFFEGAMLHYKDEKGFKIVFICEECMHTSWIDKLCEDIEEQS